MSRPQSPRWRARILRTLRALGGEGTLGDIVKLTALSRDDVEGSLDEILATDRGHVKVSESGDVVYHLAERRASPRSQRDGSEAARLPRQSRAASRRVGFDRKTLRLIRAREGVLSLAELVEHTGLPLRGAEEEMRRLAEWYGGEPHTSLDGHVVYAFPDLMVSAHEGHSIREPRPAWVRENDPMHHERSTPPEVARLAMGAMGLGASLTVPWLVLSDPTTVGLTSALGLMTSGAGVLVSGRLLLRTLGGHALLRYRRAGTLRRYALGYVFETALAGKGVVSLDRTVAYLQARAGRRRVSRLAAERALKKLAGEFDAPMTKVGGDLFFGFRNVKRQFLASHLLRRRMHLARTTDGKTVFDTADSPLAATERDLEAFDRMLMEGRPSLAVGDPIDVTELSG